MAEARYAAVFFDAAGTLFTLRESVGAGYASMALRFGFALDASAADAEFRLQLGAAAPLATGTPPPDGGRGWWRDLVFRLLRALGCGELPEEVREAYFQALYAHYADPVQWAVYPEVPGVIASLRRRHPGLVLGIISNFDQRLRGILEGLELLSAFDDIVVSTEVGYSKPERAIFEAACRRSAVRSDACLHIGDDPREDWDGARAAGFSVYELKRPERDLSGVFDFLS